MKARENPFAVDRIDRLSFRFVDGCWETLFQRLERLDYRASIVGPHGSGKTTLMEELGTRLEAAGHHVECLRLSEHVPRFSRGFLRDFWPGVTAETLILLDGAEQLSRFAWWRFQQRGRAAGGLIVTSHRAGLLPVLIECRTNHELLSNLLQDLLAERAPFVQAEAGRLFETHGGNIRGVLRTLYDQCARD